MLNSRGNQAYCIALINSYCKILNIPDTPRLIFTRKQILELPPDDRIGANNTKAMDVDYYNESNAIYVNLRNHYTKPQLIDTLVHELVHKITELKLNHGKQFDNMVSLITSLVQKN